MAEIYHGVGSGYEQALDLNLRRPMYNNKMNSLSTSIACRLVLLPIQVLDMGYNPAEGVLEQNKPPIGKDVCSFAYREMLAGVAVNELAEEVLLRRISSHCGRLASNHPHGISALHVMKMIH